MRSFSLALKLTASATVAATGLGVLAMSNFGPQATAAAPASTCSAWANVEQVFPTRFVGERRLVDTSIKLFLQVQRCSYSTDGGISRRYRLAVHNYRASGKTDLAVSLTDNTGSSSGIPGDPTCAGPVYRTYVHGHPGVPAGTTWYSAPADLTRSRPWVQGNISVHYGRTGYSASTNRCRKA